MTTNNPIAKSGARIPRSARHPNEPMTPEERAIQMWLVHPTDLTRLGMSRKTFYLAHINAAISAATGGKETNDEPI